MVVCLLLCPRCCNSKTGSSTGVMGGQVCPRKAGLTLTSVNCTFPGSKNIFLMGASSSHKQLWGTWPMQVPGLGFLGGKSSLTAALRELTIWFEASAKTQL